MLFRLFYKFRTAETAPDEASLYDAEFVDDNNEPVELSVYEIDSGAIVQTFAEHAANAGADPPRNRCGIDVRPTNCRYQKDETTAIFAHIRQAHRVICLASEQALRAFVADLFKMMKANRSCISVATKVEIRDYVRGRRHDP